MLRRYSFSTISTFFHLLLWKLYRVGYVALFIDSCFRRKSSARFGLFIYVVVKSAYCTGYSTSSLKFNKVKTFFEALLLGSTCYRCANYFIYLPFFWNPTFFTFSMQFPTLNFSYFPTFFQSAGFFIISMLPLATESAALSTSFKSATFSRIFHVVLERSIFYPTTPTLFRNPKFYIFFHLLRQC